MGERDSRADQVTDANYSNVKQSLQNPEDKELGKQAAEKENAAEDATRQADEDNGEYEKLKTMHSQLKQDADNARQKFERASRAKGRLQTAEEAQTAALESAEYARQRLEVAE